MPFPLLVVTAVEAEAEAVRAGIEAGRTRAAAIRADIEARRTTAAAIRADIEARPTTAAATRADNEARPTTAAATRADIEARPTTAAATRADNEARPTTAAATRADNEARRTTADAGPGGEVGPTTGGEGRGGEAGPTTGGGLSTRAPNGRTRDEATRAGADAGSIVVAAVGVGPAAAAAGTARLLAAGRYRAVLSAGIAGGFAGRAPVGAVVLGARSIAADLGAESPDGFLPIEELGFGRSILESDAALVEALAAALPEAIVGDVLTLATVTGTAATADRLAARFPHAVAEAMEGFGVATAATGVPFAELRAISNPVGPRDRAAWRLKEAFAALSTASAALWTSCG